MYDTLSPAELEPRSVGPVDLAWQPALIAEATALDRHFRGRRRIQLDATSWVDHVPGWLTGADAVFAELAATAAWTARTVLMYDSVVAEPRLTARWASGTEPGVLAEMRGSLAEDYRVPFDSVGVNLYRDGRDSVAWHRDRVRKRLAEPLVATISLGAARKFLLRPVGGGQSIALVPHAGDLIVMGGRCQHDWEHTVPKCSDSGPRMAVTVRHALEHTGEPASEAAIGGRSAEVRSEEGKVPARP